MSPAHFFKEKRSKGNEDDAVVAAFLLLVVLLEAPLVTILHKIIMMARSRSSSVVLTLGLAIGHVAAFSGISPFSALKQCQQLAPLAAMATEEATEVTNPRDEGLSLLLDDGTRKSHSVAENTAFVSGFFKGLSTKESYRNLVTSLFFVYEAMENSFDVTAEKRVKALDGPELRRLNSIAKDMEYFYGAQWRSMIEMSPATKAYVARIEEVSKEKPYLLIGHQYSRYLGVCIKVAMVKSPNRECVHDPC